LWKVYMLLVWLPMGFMVTWFVQSRLREKSSRQESLQICMLLFLLNAANASDQKSLYTLHKSLLDKVNKVDDATENNAGNVQEDKADDATKNNAKCNVDDEESGKVQEVHLLDGFTFLQLVKFFRLGFAVERLNMEATFVSCFFVALSALSASLLFPDSRNFIGCVATWSATNPAECIEQWDADSVLVGIVATFIVYYMVKVVSSALTFNKLYTQELGNVLDSWDEKIRWIAWHRRPNLLNHTQQADWDKMFSRVLEPVAYAMDVVPKYDVPASFFGMAITQSLQLKVVSAVVSAISLCLPTLLKKLIAQFAHHRHGD